jgi:acyl dehydratase
MAKKQIEMTQPMIDQYGQINGDNDIVHYDHQYAVERGFRGTLAHGPHLMAYAAEVGAMDFGRDWFFAGEISVKWIAPVCPGDKVEVEIMKDGTLNAKVDTGTFMVGRAGLRHE